MVVRRQKVAPPVQQKPLTLKIAIFSIIGFYLVYQIASNTSVSDWFAACPNEEFVLALARHASPDKFIILALVDTSFADMAINLYESSLRPNAINNFLFVGAGRKACEILLNASLPCFHYTEDKDTDVPSIYKSPDFIRKMNIRTDMILDALSVGFTVLHTDLDVVFLKNPLPDLKVIMLNADIATMWDSVAYNAGFVVVKPTWYSKKIYERMKTITGFSAKTDDQSALNTAIYRMSRVYKRSGFSAVALDVKKYLCGVDYFEKGNRLFATNCSTCSVVHNNWIVSREAKIYRFKEHMMWMYDKESYYSDPVQNYVTYSNPLIWSTEQTSAEEELGALKAALLIGRILNRIVILPRFHCSGAGIYGKAAGASTSVKVHYATAPKGKAPAKKETLPSRECPLNSLLNVTAFDAVFGDRYRESSFLQHPLVRDEVRMSRSLAHAIVTRSNAELLQNLQLKSSINYIPISRSSSSSGSSNGSSVPGMIGTSSAPPPPPSMSAVTDDGLHVIDLTSSDSVLESDISETLAGSNSKVLVFHFLYRSAPTLSRHEEQTAFEADVKRAFHRGSYRQL